MEKYIEELNICMNILAGISPRVDQVNTVSVPIINVMNR